MTAALLPAFTLSASAGISPQSVRTPVETSLLSVTGAPETVNVAEGHTYETTLGTSPNTTVTLPTGCGYCPSMTGMGKTDFGTAVTLPRAQFVTMLYRMEGSPAVVYTPKFLDVPDNTFYSLAVIWASDSSRKIVSGYNKDYFGPSDSVTREQIATILYRYAKYKGYDTGKTADLSAYPDAGNVSSYAKAAMEWAVGTGLISGDKGYLNPQKTAIRAECAVILMRFLMNYSS